MKPGEAHAAQPKQPLVPSAPAAGEPAVLDRLCKIEQLLTEMKNVQAAANTPARLRTITFSPTELVTRDEVGPKALSVGVINPTSVRIYLGLGGEKAGPNNHAFAVPAQSGMVIPVAVDQVEIGADPTDLGEDTATIFWLRFAAVQQFLLWTL